MRVTLKVKPNAKSEKVESRPDGSLLVWVKAPPVDGKANEAVIRALAEHYGVPRSRVQIVLGTSGRNKSAEIEGLSSPA